MGEAQADAYRAVRIIVQRVHEERGVILTLGSHTQLPAAQRKQEPVFQTKAIESSEPLVLKRNGMRGVGAVACLTNYLRDNNLDENGTYDIYAHVQSVKRGDPLAVQQASLSRCVTQEELDYSLDSIIETSQGVLEAPRKYSALGLPLTIMILRRDHAPPLVLLGDDALCFLILSRAATGVHSLALGWCGFSAEKTGLVLGGHLTDAMNSFRGTASGAVLGLFSALVAESDAPCFSRGFVTLLRQVFKKVERGFHVKFEGVAVQIAFLRNGSGVIGILAMHNAFMRAEKRSPAVGEALIAFALADLHEGQLVSEGRVARAKTRIQEVTQLGPFPDSTKMDAEVYNDQPTWMRGVSYDDLKAFANLDKLPVVHPKTGDISAVLARDIAEVRHHGIPYQPLNFFLARLDLFLENSGDHRCHPRNTSVSLSTQAGLLAGRAFPSRANLSGFAFRELVRCEAEFTLICPEVTLLLDGHLPPPDSTLLRTLEVIMNECLMRAVVIELTPIADHMPVCPGASCTAKHLHIPACYAPVVRKADKERYPKVLLELLNAALELILPAANHVLREMSIGKVMGGPKLEQSWRPIEGDVLTAALDAKGSTDHRSPVTMDRLTALGHLLKRKHFPSRASCLAAQLAVRCLAARAVCLESRPSWVRFKGYGLAARNLKDALALSGSSMRARVHATGKLPYPPKKELPIGDHMSANIDRIQSSTKATPLTKNLWPLVNTLARGGKFYFNADAGQGKDVVMNQVGCQLGARSLCSSIRAGLRASATKEAIALAKVLGITGNQRLGRFSVETLSRLEKNREWSARVLHMMEFYAAQILRGERRPVVAWLNEVNAPSPYLCAAIDAALANPDVTLVLCGAGNKSVAHYESLGFQPLPFDKPEKARADPEYHFASEEHANLEALAAAGRQKSGVVLVYRSTTSKCDAGARFLQSHGVDCAVLHGGASPEMTTKAISDAPDAVRVVFMTTAGFYGHNFDHCHQLIAEMKFSFHGFCHATGQNAVMDVELTTDFFYQLLMRLSRQVGDKAPRVVLLSTTDSTYPRLEGDFTRADSRAEYQAIRSRTTRGSFRGPWTPDLVNTPEDVIRILGLSGGLGPINVQRGAAFHFGAVNRNLSHLPRIPARHSFIRNLIGTYAPADVPPEDFLVCWMIARGSVTGLQMTHDAALYGMDRDDLTSAEKTEILKLDARSPELFWRDPAYYCDLLIRKMPQCGGRRDAIMGELNEDFQNFYGRTYMGWCLAHPDRFTEPSTTQIFSKILARCCPTGISLVEGRGFARNLVYDSVFSIPDEIPVGAYIVAPNRSTIRHGARSIAKTGLIALVAPWTKASSYPCEGEEEATPSQIAERSVQRGKTEESWLKIGDMDPYASQLIVQRDTIFRGDAQVQLITGEFYLHPIPLRQAVTDFSREYTAFRAEFFVIGIILRIAQELGTTGGFALLNALTDAFNTAPCILQCAQLLPLVLASPTCPPRILRMWRDLTEKEVRFLKGKKLKSLDRSATFLACAIVNDTFGDDSLAQCGGPAPRAALLLVRVHFFLIEQPEHPETVRSGNDDAGSSKSMAVWTVRAGQSTGARVAWCSRLYSTEVRERRGKQETRFVVEPLIRSGALLYAMGKIPGFLVGIESPHSWASGVELLEKETESAPDELHGAAKCLAGLAVLFPESTDPGFDRASLRPYTLSEERFMLFRHYSKCVGPEQGSVRVGCTDQLEVCPDWDNEVAEVSLSDKAAQTGLSLQGRAMAWFTRAEIIRPVYPTGVSALARSTRERKVERYVSLTNVRKVTAAMKTHASKILEGLDHVAISGIDHP